MASIDATDRRMKGSVRREYRGRVANAIMDVEIAVENLNGLIRDMREDHPKDSEAARSFLALGRARLHDALDSFETAKRELQ